LNTRRSDQYLLLLTKALARQIFEIVDRALNRKRRVEKNQSQECLREVPPSVSLVLGDGGHIFNLVRQLF
jgi:hypothetical protein